MNYIYIHLGKNHNLCVSIIQSIKQIFEMDIVKNLPPELTRVIGSYLEYPEVPTCRLIKEIIDVYHIDHSWSHTKRTKKYHIDFILSFSEYYFDIINNVWDYESSRDYGNWIVV